MQTIKLLLVEDDEDDYIITKDLLREIETVDIDLYWEQDVASAKLALQQSQYDVCLLDYRLGGEDGLSLLRESVHNEGACPFIMLTGQDDERLDKEALSAGAVDYLVKSYLTTSRLARAIRYAAARRETEQARVERLKAESESQAKSQFLAHLSHELRTPLTAVLGYTELLSRDATSETQQQHLQVIMRNGRHLLDLLNDILDLTKIEAGKLEIESTKVELNELISDLYLLMRVKALDKNLKLIFRANRSLPKYIVTDPTRLRQILVNLLGNAIKFTDQGEVSLEIDLIEQHSQVQLMFSVKDTGVGISELDIGNLFRPFSQLKNSNNQSERGTGLGLAISQQLVQRLGGNISVESQPDRGSTFCVQLNFEPQAVSSESVPIELRLAEASNPARLDLLAGANILVADDLIDVRHLMGFFLESAGAKVIYADNGARAVTRALASQDSDQPIDLILMDMNMPEMDGLEATQALRAQQFSKPILALTAATMKGERERCLAAGFSDHLSKPIDESQLIKRVKEHWDKTKESSNRLGIEPNQPHRLLLVEDDDDARMATSLLLQSLGIEVTAVGLAADALAAWETQSYDTVITDLNLPDGDGRALAKTIKQRHPAATLLALTGQHMSSSEVKGSGFDQFYLKPLSLKKIKTMLNLG